MTHLTIHFPFQSNPVSLGILTGAGPMAGIHAAKQIIQTLQTSHQCQEDKDFPNYRLVNLPFSNMLDDDICEDQIQNELIFGIDLLKKMGCQKWLIACNTLHAFLPEPYEKMPELIHLVDLTIKNIHHTEEKPIILCTSTSRKKDLYGRRFQCEYPRSDIQIQVDDLIADVLRGQQNKAIQSMHKIFSLFKGRTFILACTELSTLTAYRSFWESKPKIIDPLQEAIDAYLVYFTRFGEIL